MSWRSVLILAVVLAALVIWDRALTQRTAHDRLTSARVGQLLSPELFEQRSVAALRVDVGDDQQHLYAYFDGLWRCASAHRAPADNTLIEAIIPALLDAEGVVRTSDPAAAAQFGFDDEHTVRVSICGPEVMTDPTGDVIASVDLGSSIASTGGSYVRLAGSDDIWAVDIDLRTLMAYDPDSSAPPMLDPLIMPQAWPGHRAGPARIIVHPTNEQPIVITREATPSDVQGAYRWLVSRGEESFVGDVFQVTSFAVFLLRAEYAGILAPRDPAELGLARPRARIGIESGEGHQVQYIIGSAGPRGGVAVYNTFSEVAYEVEPELIERMLPELDQLLSDVHGNPWERWMRR